MKAHYVVVIVLVVVFVSVILVGSFAACWYGANMSPKPNFDVKVVYAYIGHSQINNETGLNSDLCLTGQSYNMLQSYNLDSYIIILKVTNNGAQTLKLSESKVFVAENIVENEIGFNDTNGNPAPDGLGEPLVVVHNSVVSDERSGLGSNPVLSPYLDAGESRLLAFTGLISIGKLDGQYLQNGTAYLMGSLIAQNYGDNKATQSGFASDIEHVTFQDLGNGEYLYNNLLGPGQTLIINQLDAQVGKSK
jgi:hypothetical protein